MGWLKPRYSLRCRFDRLGFSPGARLFLALPQIDTA